MMKLAILALFVAVCVAHECDWKADFDLYEEAVEEDFEELTCYNCTITWDTYTMEYVDCTKYAECPAYLEEKTETTHDPARTYQLVNWRFVMKKNTPERILKIGVNELHWDLDIDMGVEGNGIEEVESCDECIGLYLDYQGEKSIYNYCMIIPCPSYFTGDFKWDLVRPQTHQELMDVTAYDLPKKVRGRTITHAHSYLDWSKTPLMEELARK